MDVTTVNKSTINKEVKEYYHKIKKRKKKERDNGKNRYEIYLKKKQTTKERYGQNLYRTEEEKDKKRMQSKLLFYCYF